MHLVYFYEDYHDARSLEHEVLYLYPPPPPLGFRGLFQGELHTHILVVC
jgi:hypothetical protein